MDLQKKLMEIGFTEYEAKVYLAMLSVYPATGYQLSKESGVPRSMVYEALKRLHAKGAALETVEGRATLYREGCKYLIQVVMKRVVRKNSAGHPSDDCY